MTPDEQLVADAVERARGTIRADLLAELPAVEAAAFLREEALRSLGGPAGIYHHLGLQELDIMVRFHRLRAQRPSLRKLHFPD